MAPEVKDQRVGSGSEVHGRDGGWSGIRGAAEAAQLDVANVAVQAFDTLEAIVAAALRCAHSIALLGVGVRTIGKPLSIEQDSEMFVLAHLLQMRRQCVGKGARARDRVVLVPRGPLADRGSHLLSDVEEDVRVLELLDGAVDHTLLGRGVEHRIWRPGAGLRGSGCQVVTAATALPLRPLE